MDVVAKNMGAIKGEKQERALRVKIYLNSLVGILVNIHVSMDHIKMTTTLKTSTRKKFPI